MRASKCIQMFSVEHSKVKSKKLKLYIKQNSKKELEKNGPHSSTIIRVSKEQMEANP